MNNDSLQLNSSARKAFGYRGSIKTQQEQLMEEHLPNENAKNTARKSIDLTNSNLNNDHITTMNHHDKPRSNSTSNNNSSSVSSNASSVSSPPGPTANSSSISRVFGGFIKSTTGIIAKGKEAIDVVKHQQQQIRGKKNIDQPQPPQTIMPPSPSNKAQPAAVTATAIQGTASSNPKSSSAASGYPSISLNSNDESNESSTMGPPPSSPSSSSQQQQQHKQSTAQTSLSTSSAILKAIGKYSNNSIASTNSSKQEPSQADTSHESSSTLLPTLVPQKKMIEHSPTSSSPPLPSNMNDDYNYYDDINPQPVGVGDAQTATATTAAVPQSQIKKRKGLLSEITRAGKDKFNKYKEKIADKAAETYHQIKDVYDVVKPRSSIDEEMEEDVADADEFGEEDEENNFEDEDDDEQDKSGDENTQPRSSMSNSEEAIDGDQNSHKADIQDKNSDDKSNPTQGPNLSFVLNTKSGQMQAMHSKTGKIGTVRITITECRQLFSVYSGMSIAKKAGKPFFIIAVEDKIRKSGMAEPVFPVKISGNSNEDSTQSNSQTQTQGKDTSLVNSKEGEPASAASSLSKPSSTDAAIATAKPANVKPIYGAFEWKDASWEFPITDLLGDIRITFGYEQPYSHKKSALGSVAIPIRALLPSPLNGLPKPIAEIIPLLPAFSISPHNDKISDSWYELYPPLSRSKPKYRPGIEKVVSSAMKRPSKRLGFVHIKCEIDFVENLESSMGMLMQIKNILFKPQYILNLEMKAKKLEQDRIIDEQLKGLANLPQSKDANQTKTNAVETGTDSVSTDAKGASSASTTTAVAVTITAQVPKAPVSSSTRLKNTLGILHATREARRNMTRVSRAALKAYDIFVMIPLDLIEHGRSWRVPSHSVGMIFGVYYVCMVMPSWQIPLIPFAIASWMSLSALPSMRQRELPTPIIVWNDEIVDPEKDFTLMQKSDSAARFVESVQQRAGEVADMLERMNNIFAFKNDRVTLSVLFATLFMGLLLGFIRIVVLQIESYFEAPGLVPCMIFSYILLPQDVRMLLRKLHIILIGPPRIVAYIINTYQSLRGWPMVPTSDEFGHQYICSLQLQKGSATEPGYVHQAKSGSLSVNTSNTSSQSPAASPKENPILVASTSSKNTTQTSTSDIVPVSQAPSNPSTASSFVSMFTGGRASLASSKSQQKQPVTSTRADAKSENKLVDAKTEVKSGNPITSDSVVVSNDMKIKDEKASANAVTTTATTNIVPASEESSTVIQDEQVASLGPAISAILNSEKPKPSQIAPKSEPVVETSLDMEQNVTIQSISDDEDAHDFQSTKKSINENQSSIATEIVQKEMEIVSTDVPNKHQDQNKHEEINKIQDGSQENTDSNSDSQIEHQSSINVTDHLNIEGKETISKESEEKSEKQDIATTKSVPVEEIVLEDDQSNDNDNKSIKSEVDEIMKEIFDS